MDGSSHARKGLLCAVAAYLWWGAIPLYFKAVATVPSLLVLDHRILWSALFMVLLVSWQHRWPGIVTLCRQRGKLGFLAVAAVLIAVNWGTFIYAVAISKLMQASLGYFINPLFSMFLGMVFLRERLRPMQWFAVITACVGVAYLTWQTGEFPWIAMLLAGSFGLYGLVRKVIGVPPIEGLAIETLALVLPAAGLLPSLTARAPALSFGMYIILSLAGIITVLPLYWFTYAVQHLRLTTVGFLQYIGPTGQFLVALLIFGEPLDRNKLIAFIFCWCAVVIYTWSTWRMAFQAKPVPMAAETPVTLTNRR